MKITGELLKSERIKLKLSQQDIAFALKLSPRIINAIEEGDVENLPAKTFVRGFVKSYAEMLKLDSTLVLNQYHEEMGTAQPISKVVSAPSENAKAKSTKLDETTTKHTAISSVTPSLKMNLNRNTLKITLLIAFAVIVLGGINKVVNKYQKEGIGTDPQNLSVETLNQEVNAPLAPTPVLSPAANTTSGEASSPTSVVAAATTPVATPVTSPSPIASPSESPAVVMNSPTPSPSPVGKSIELVIEANKDTTISYTTGSDAEAKTITLRKDSIQIIKSKNGLTLKIAEGNAISITVNGVNKGLASSDAKPLELSF